MNHAFKSDFIKNLTYNPSTEQLDAIDKLVNFVASSESQVCILNGHAGTGKTSMVAALVNTLEAYHTPCVLMAPTGRAAKVMAKYAGHPAYTIHKIIFRQANIDINAKFSLAFNKRKNALFVVDEASMMSARHEDTIAAMSLLKAVMQFVFENNNRCKLLIVGDNAQLPPVNEVNSPALNQDFYKQNALSTTFIQLKEVIRQKVDSGILYNATIIRSFIETNAKGTFPKIICDGFADIVRVRGDELVETITECYERDGMEETIVVCRSNKTANIYNRGIRNQILWKEAVLESSDMVMVVKNNYFWKVNDNQEENNIEKSSDFIANGDAAIVKMVRNFRDLYGFTFADCTLQLVDYEDSEMDVVVLTDTLNAEAPALTEQQQQDLFNRVMEDYQDITNKAERIKQLKNDIYFNALQIKYAYAVTCHKAQGGQWKNVFIDQGMIPNDFQVLEYYKWLYTAITRATDKVFLVNWKEPKNMVNL